VGSFESPVHRTRRRASSDTMQIGEVAELVGLSLRTIRYYGEVGLAPPSARTPGGFRLYTGDDVARLLLIMHMKPLSFSLDEMRELLEARDRIGVSTSPAEREELLARIGGFARQAEDRCVELREQLSVAESLATQLREEFERRHELELVAGERSPAEASPLRD
jgi:DNA-binding transcriptional MerR regulator